MIELDESRLAADLGELALDYSDTQLKDLRIGTLRRQRKCYEDCQRHES
jgi:hypothetical protein